MTGAAETELCRIFAEVLSLDQVSADDAFFDVGGDSVLALKVVARAREAGLELSVRDVFDHQTAATLAGVAHALPAAGSPRADAPDGAAPPDQPLVLVGADELGDFEDDDLEDETQQATDANLGWETVT